MEGLKEGLGLLQVAVPTLIHHAESEVFGVGSVDRMREVTTRAGRQLLVGVIVPRPMDTFFELLLDAVMAETACLGNIQRVDR